jgi:hypothetical protein
MAVHSDGDALASHQWIQRWLADPFPADCEELQMNAEHEWAAFCARKRSFPDTCIVPSRKLAQKTHTVSLHEASSLWDISTADIVTVTSFEEKESLRSFLQRSAADSCVDMAVTDTGATETRQDNVQDSKPAASDAELFDFFDQMLDVEPVGDHKSMREAEAAAAPETVPAIDTSVPQRESCTDASAQEMHETEAALQRSVDAVPSGVQHQCQSSDENASALQEQQEEAIGNGGADTEKAERPECNGVQKEAKAERKKKKKKHKKLHKLPKKAIDKKEKGRRHKKDKKRKEKNKEKKRKKKEEQDKQEDEEDEGIDISKSSKTDDDALSDLSEDERVELKQLCKSEAAEKQKEKRAGGSTGGKEKVKYMKGAKKLMRMEEKLSRKRVRDNPELKGAVQELFELSPENVLPDNVKRRRTLSLSGRAYEAVRVFVEKVWDRENDPRMRKLPKQLRSLAFSFVRGSRDSED